jgi:beta-glucuronidase
LLKASVETKAWSRAAAPSAARVVAAVLGCAFATALAAPPALGAYVPPAGALYHDGPSGRYQLAGDWYERADPGDGGTRAGFHTATGRAGWTRTSVPDAANAGDFSQQSYLGGVHWYRKDFSAPAGPARARWVLRFESVNYRATVWLNGRPIGRHAGAYLPFELDAGSIKRRGTNRLVVRVDSRRSLTDVPSLAVRHDGRFVGGWWNYTGILREVYLRRVDTLDLASVHVKPELGCATCAATVKFDVLVRNLSSRRTLAVLEARIGGQVVGFRPALVPPGRYRRLRAGVRIQNPQLWSPASPKLYRVAFSLRDDKRLRQRYTVRTGIRSLEVRRGRLLLNDREVSLRGASMHEDDTVRGAALGPTQIRENIDLLRELGATITRAHYPLHPLTLELADRYGIAVWSEIPVYQMQDMLFRRDSVRRQSVRMLRDMVLRDRNHPSVLVWSVGNENTTRPGPGFRRYVRQAKRSVRRLDRTRLIGIAFPGYPTLGETSLFESFDALGVNDYFGWYPGPDGSIVNREDLGPYLDQLHEFYPRQALFVTEFGAEANRTGPATEKGTFEFQRDFLAYHLSVFETRPFVNAAIVWILRDFRVKPGYDGGNPQPQPPVNQKGLVDDSGARKPGFQVVQQQLQALRDGRR